VNDHAVHPPEPKRTCGSLPWSLRAVLLIVPVLLVAACSVCLHPHRNIWLVDETYEGKTTYVKTGDWIRVVLPTGPTKGLSWEVTREGGSVVEDGETHLDEAPPVAGAQARVTIPFRAERPGVTDLTFSYRRPREKDVPPARTLHVTVFVQ
jgi:predicted secreted protein